MPVVDELTCWCEQQQNTTVHSVSEGTSQRILIENRQKSDPYAHGVCTCVCVCLCEGVCLWGFLGMM